MKFQLFGTLEYWSDGFSLPSQILKEFEADSIEAAIELADKKLRELAERSTKCDNGDGGSAFKELEAELRVIQSVWKGAIKPCSVTKCKEVTERENVLKGTRI